VAAFLLGEHAAMRAGAPFLTARTEVSEQAGVDQGQAIRSAEQNESARRARRTRAKGGAAQDVPSPPVRQAEE